MIDGLSVIQAVVSLPPLPGGGVAVEIDGALLLVRGTDDATRGALASLKKGAKLFALGSITEMYTTPPPMAVCAIAFNALAIDTGGKLIVAQGRREELQRHMLDAVAGIPKDKLSTREAHRLLSISGALMTAEQRAALLASAVASGKLPKPDFIDSDGLPMFSVERLAKHTGGGEAEMLRLMAQMGIDPTTGEQGFFRRAS